MSACLSIFKREFCGYFRTPVAYVFMTVFLVAVAGLTWFIGDYFDSNEASLGILFLFMPWVFLFFIPAAGMRLWAEEKRSGTWELLLTWPVSSTQAVVGKFLAGWLFISLCVLLTFPMVLTTAYLGDPQWGPIFSGYLGALLMAGAYLSICSLCSAFTKSQVVAFVISVIVCLILVFLGWSVFNQLLSAVGLPQTAVDALANFSFVTHFDPLVKGIVNIRDIVFFVSLIVFSLGMNVLMIER
jgi:ABC-2 type transport system permease protein